MQTWEAFVDFSNKAVLITGSTRGIGRVTAERMLELGARIAINGRTADGVASTIADLGTADRLVAAPGDVSTAGGCKKVVDRAIDGLGRLDILINNAGVYPIVAMHEVDEALWDSTIDINLKSTFFCAQAAAPALKSCGGVIVNHASIAGLRGFAGVSVYCASKGGVVLLTKAMALELAPEIRVNCVCPTTVDTEMGRQEFDRTEDPQAAFDAFEADSPLKRIATTGDVAAAILYLASDQAAYHSGVALPVDGGKAATR